MLSKKNNNSYNTLKHFDLIFNTDTRHSIKQMPLFEAFYEYFSDDFYTPSEETKSLMKKRRILLVKFDKTFTEEQKKLFEELYDANGIIEEELRKQFFLFGYITATELFLETTNKKS